MRNIQATEFKEETRQLFENISSSLVNLKTYNDDKSLFYKHYLYWHEVKSLATLFSLHDIAAISHEIESLFDLVSNEDMSLSQTDLNCFGDSLDYIKASLDNSINNKSHELDLDNLLKKIHNTNRATLSKKAPSSPTPSPANNQTQSSQAHTPKILIVEDEPINMTLLEANIKDFSNDFEIISANSAEEGLFHFFTNKFDLIFLDIMMPVIDGNDFIAIIEKNIEKKNISTRCNIVVQTAIQSMAQLTAFAKKECVQEIIRKPISPTRINECLVRYCIEPYNHLNAA